MEQNIIGTTIAALRREKGLTQDALAAQLGVSAQAVSKWESGKGYPEVLVLKVDVDVKCLRREHPGVVQRCAERRVRPGGAGRCLPRSPVERRGNGAARRALRRA